MGKILDALNAKVFTRAVPKSATAQLKVLMRASKGSTKAVAERLGVSQRAVQRYLKGDRKPTGKIAARLADETTKVWQPRVRARAEKRARESGVTVETRASFGFSAAPGTTDDPRMRRITETMPPDLVGDMWAAYRAGDEHRLQELIGAGLGEAYFRDRGRRADGLDVELTDIDYIDLDWDLYEDG